MGSEDLSVRTLDLPVPESLVEHVLNPLLAWVLRSPLHGLLSDSLLLITVTGTNTGREYTTPVGYERRGDALFVTSQTDHTWWRNLRGGAPVTVDLRGRRREGHATVVEDDHAVAEYVHGFLERHGREDARRLALAIEGDGEATPATLAPGLGDTVLVRIDLQDA